MPIFIGFQASCREPGLPAGGHRSHPPGVLGYEVQGEVARGSASVVFRARSASGALVAIKVLSRRDPRAERRFERERKLAASLGSQQGFVPLLETGTTPSGEPYYVMPFLEGGTLRRRLERGPLAIPDALALVRALANAVAIAHERGIVHRDLKPENVLFSSDGRPLVADLGIAKEIDREHASVSIDLTVSGSPLGTAGYMAPEQLEEAGTAGPSADVFALGAILHECLAGVPPFRGESVLDVLARLAEARPVPLRALRPEVPRWLEAVVARAMASEPAKRFAHAGAFARALEEPGLPARNGRWIAVALVVAGAVAAILAARGRP